MISAVVVTEMDLLMVVLTLFFWAKIEAKKEFLRTGLVDDIKLTSSSSEEDPSQTVAVLILEHNELFKNALKSEESDESFSIWNPKIIMDVPWKSNPRSDHTDTDSSGESNSDEYEDTTETDTDSDSNYYNEDDYIADAVDQLNLAALVSEESAVLRKRWKSCRNQAAKVCREACVASAENACDAHRCKSKLKKAMKKECKTNCKDFFQ